MFAQITAFDVVVGEREIGERVVGEYVRVPIGLVAEIVENAFFFEQPRHELKVGFLVLNTAFTPRVLIAERPLEIGKPRIGGREFAENLLDDFRQPNGFGSCAGGLGEQPEPRHDGGAVRRTEAALADITEPANDTVPVSRCRAAAICERDRLTDDERRGERRVGGE